MNPLGLPISPAAPRPRRTASVAAGAAAASLALCLVAGAAGAQEAQRPNQTGLAAAVAARRAQSPTATPGAAKAPAPARPLAAPVPASYKIHSGDVLRIAVPGRPEMTELLTVPEDGRISFPYVNEFRAADLTCSQIAARIKSDLKKEFRNPPVQVQVVEKHRRTARVMGDAVKTTGRLEVADDARLLDLLMSAGGLTVQYPEWAKATLVRAKSDEQIDVDLPKLVTGADRSVNVPLQDGDTLFVQTVDRSERQIQVMGAVKKPGPYPAVGETTLMEAITAADNFTPTASLQQAYIERKGSKDKKILVDLTDLSVAGKPQPTAKLYPGDTLYIPNTSRLFVVAGAVATPVKLPYPEKEGITALGALYVAGGPGGGAELKNASIVRKPEGAADLQILPIDLEKVLKEARNKKNLNKPASEYGDVALQPGDVLVIPAKGAPSNRGNILNTITNTVGSLWWLFL